MNVIKDFVTNELISTCPSLHPTIVDDLSSASSAYFENRVTISFLTNKFLEFNSPMYIIPKLMRMKSMNEDALPPIADVRKENRYNNRKRAVAWTEEEDLRLVTAVYKYGSRDWRIIAAFVGSGRTSSQCNQRWTRALNPLILHTPWSSDDDQRLLAIVAASGKCKWRKIADYFAGRTDLQCRHRYLFLQKKQVPSNAPIKESIENLNCNQELSEDDSDDYNPLSINNLMNWNPQRKIQDSINHKDLFFPRFPIKVTT